jgi:hypothetical protein
MNVSQSAHYHAIMDKVTAACQARAALGGLRLRYAREAVSQDEINRIEEADGAAYAAVCRTVIKSIEAVAAAKEG